MSPKQRRILKKIRYVISHGMANAIARGDTETQLQRYKLKIFKWKQDLSPMAISLQDLEAFFRQCVVEATERANQQKQDVVNNSYWNSVYHQNQVQNKVQENSLLYSNSVSTYYTEKVSPNPFQYIPFEFEDVTLDPIVDTEE